MPKIVDHHQRRREIAETVLGIVARAGIDGVTLREVARHSGWSTGILSHYVGSRDDLLLLALRRAANIAGERFREISASEHMTHQEKLEELISSSLPLGTSGIALGRIFLFYYSQSLTNEEVGREMRHYLANWRHDVEECVRSIIEAEDLPQVADPIRLAANLIALADGFSMHAILDPQILELLESDLIVNSWVTSVLGLSV